MKQYMDSILEQVHQRMDWKDKRLNESNKYVDKVLKASRNLEARTKSTPLMLRTFALDVPTTIVMMNKETTQNNSNTSKAYNSGGSSRKDQLSSRNSGRKTIKAKNVLNRTENNFNLFKNRNKGNNHAFENFFEMKNDLMVNPDEDGLPARRIKLMMRAREPKITNVWPNHKPMPDQKTFRETLHRVGPKLKKVMEEDLRIMVWGDREQEMFREKLTRSMSCEKIASSQVDVQFMNIQGLEPTGERSFRNRKNESFMIMETSRITRKMLDMYDRDFEVKMRMNERTTSNHSLGPRMYPSLPASRASVGCISNRDHSSQWIEAGEEDKTKIHKGVSDLSRSKAEGESMSLLKALDMVSLNAEIKQKAIISKLKKSVTRRKADIEESYGDSKTSRSPDVKDKGPYLKAFARKAVSVEKQRVKALNIGIPVDSKKIMVTSTTEEDLSDIKIEGNRETIKPKERDRMSAKYRSRERESEGTSRGEFSRESGDGGKKAFGEWNYENLMMKTKHNMFRFKQKKSSRSVERDESLSRKMLL